MERSIGFERTIKPRDFESLKVTSFLSGIPEDKALDSSFIVNLYNLMIVQSYKAIFNEEQLLKDLRAQNEDKMVYLQSIENSLLETLGVDGLIVKTNLEKV